MFTSVSRKRTPVYQNAVSQQKLKIPFQATVNYLDIKASRTQALAVSAGRETNYHVVGPRLVVQSHLLVLDKHEDGMAFTFHTVVQIQQTYKDTHLLYSKGTSFQLTTEPWVGSNMLCDWLGKPHHFLYQ